MSEALEPTTEVVEQPLLSDQARRRLMAQIAEGQPHYQSDLDEASWTRGDWS